MRDTATDSVRSHRRADGFRLAGICGAFVALQITVVTMMPPRLRGVTAGLLTMVTVVGVIVVAMEVSFKRAAMRAADATARPAGLPRRPRERVSPLIQRAYYLARRDASAPLIARTCDVPEAFAALIIDDVRRTASREGRTTRDPSGRPHDDGRKPENPPPAI
jgi:hypothetical protein